MTLYDEMLAMPGDAMEFEVYRGATNEPPTVVLVKVEVEVR